MELRFCESESAFSYFTAMRSYLAQHGKPVALNSDQHRDPCANTPAAKGRVERVRACRCS